LKEEQDRLKAGILKLNDEILIIGSTTGAVEDTIKEIRLDMKPAENAKKGDIISIPVSEKVRRNDKLYLLEKTEFAK